MRLGVLKEFTAFEEKDWDKVECTVEFGGSSENRNEFIKSVYYASVLVYIATVDEATSVYMLGELITDFFDHFCFVCKYDVTYVS